VRIGSRGIGIAARWVWDDVGWTDAAGRMVIWREVCGENFRIALDIVYGGCGMGWNCLMHWVGVRRERD
jgi:hypothetical protein